MTAYHEVAIRAATDALAAAILAAVRAEAALGGWTCGRTWTPTAPDPSLWPAMIAYRRNGGTMSYDESDYYADLQWEHFYKEIAPQAIEDFVKERMASYYDGHRDLALPAGGLLDEAAAQRNSHPRAATVFAVAAAEVCLKNAILKPLFQGLVHDQHMADAVAEVAVGQTGLDRFNGFLAQYMASVGGDLRTYCRGGSKNTLLAELRQAQNVRNTIVHRGSPAEPEDADLALAVAQAIADDILDPVLASVGFHRHPDWWICDRPASCKGVTSKPQTPAFAGEDGPRGRLTGSAEDDEFIEIGG